jgi:tight adherence protein C
LLALIGALFIGGALFYVLYTTQKAAETSSAEERLNIEWGSDEKRFVPPFYLRLTKPLLQGGYVSVASGLWSNASLAAYKKKLVTAAMIRYVQPEHFVAAKFYMALFATIFSALMYFFAETPPPPWVIIGMPLLAFFLPDIDLNSRVTSRQFDCRLAMPYVVDLLALSTEAGLDFMGAIGKVVERAPPSAFIEELQIVLKDIQLGKTRAESLRSMAERLGMMELSSFVAVLVSSDQMGASIGGALRSQSESMRSERLVRAEKLGAQASQKILIPLVFFILPAVMLVIFGPLILQFVGAK